MKEYKKCKVDWCNGNVYSIDLCRPHTTHIYRYGKTRLFDNTPNEKIDKGNYYELILYKRGQIDSGLRVKVSKQSYEEIKHLRFYFSKSQYSGYAKVARSDGKFLHQILSKCEYPLVCDHVNRDKLDCRIENLRCVTRLENNLNK